MAKILDGKALAQKIKANLAPGFKKFEKTHGRKCTLAVVLIGNNPASEIYIASKTKTAEELGARVIVHRFADGETQAKIQKAIEDRKSVV
jgi:methylenetetrahydrofolate dehydrogenase (NADP+)/methenyltetrahydrofolate cyclohydrolase